MNTDLPTEDLKKKRSSNESYWYRGTLSLPFEPASIAASLGRSSTIAGSKA